MPSRILQVAATALAVSSTLVHGQVGELAPVALDDSPTAQRALDEAYTQAADNPERTASLIADLLDEYGVRVVPAGDEDLFQSVRGRVGELLRSDRGVRQAWRRAEDARSTTMLDREGFEATYRRRPFTQGGLEAGLRLAQRFVETGSPDAGLRVLDEMEAWPGVEAEETRMTILRGLALIDLVRRSQDDPGLGLELRRVVEALRVLDPDAGRELERVAGRIAGVQVEDRRPSFEDLSTRDWTPLWEVPLEDSLFLRKTTNMSTGRVLAPTNAKRNLEAGSYLVTVPAVHEDLVIFNEGYLVEAVDRYTGRLVWYRDRGLSRGITPTGLPSDLNRIVLFGDEAYTILGHHFPTGRSSGGEVIRFDPQTGVERWKVRVDELLAGMQVGEADPVGTPVVVGELLLLPLRESTTRLETIDMVLAVDRAEGRFRWLRTIASSGKQRSSPGRPLSELVPIEDDVVFASAAGAIARLDGRSGEVRWLRRDEVPLQLRQSTYAWQLGGPAVLDRGIAVLGAGRSDWMLLDSETGALLDRRPIGAGTAAGTATSLHALEDVGPNGDLLLAVGPDDVVALDPADPGGRVWSLRERLAERDLPFGLPAQSGVRGRVQVIEGGVVVPVVDGLYLVDGSSGTPRWLLETPGPTNPTVVADAIYAAGGRSLIASMPIEDAILALEARIRASPDAIPQSLALMELSERIGRTDLLLFSARTAMEAAVDAPAPRWRADVLDRILDVLSRQEGETGEALLAFGRTLAREPAARARLQLAEGDWFARTERPGDAVDSWLRIIQDDAFASVEVEYDGRLVGPASVAARSRLRSLLSGEPAAKEGLLRDAEARIDEALAGEPTAAELMVLMRSYEGTEPANRAALRAAELFAEDDRPLLVAMVAMVALRGADAISDPIRRRILDLAINAAEEAGRPDLRDALSRIAPGSDPSMATDDSRIRRPSLGIAADRIEVIPGTPVAVDPRVAGTAPTDGLLMMEGNELVWRSGPDLDRAWSIDLETAGSEVFGGMPIVIAFEPSLHVWQGDSRGGRLTAIDLGSGSVLWESARIPELLPPSREPERVGGIVNVQSRPDGTPFVPFDLVPIVLGDGVALVRRDGAASFIDGRDGRTVRWSTDGLLDRVYDVELGGGLLHLGGAIGTGDATVGMVVTLDPRTGRILHKATVEDPEILESVSDDWGRVAVRTRSGITLIDPAAAAIGLEGGWTRGGEAGAGLMSPEIAMVRLAGDRVLLVGLDGGVREFDVEVGGSSGADWDRAPDGDRAPGKLLEMTRLDDRWLLRHVSRAFLHDLDGRMVGADGIARRDLENVAAVPVEDGLVLVSRDSARRIYRVHRLDDRRGLLATAQPFDFASAMRMDRVAVVDGWLIFQQGNRTYGLPMGIDEVPSTDP